MKKDYMLTASLAILALAVLGLFAALLIQSSRVNRLSEALNRVSDRLEAKAPQAPNETEKKPSEKNTFTDINQKIVTVEGSEIKFIHRCNGKVESGKVFGGDQSIAFCLGNNQLVVADGKTEKVLAEIDSEDRENAPVLLDAAVIPNSKNQTILLSFRPETCTTTGECGAGMPTNYVSYAYEMKDQALYSLKNYPESGALIWNQDATKALFVQDTCGGAGCSITHLDGYDLASDTVRTLTEEQAAPPMEAKATDPTGERLPQWSSISWNQDDSGFTAKIIGTKGETKNIEGRF